MEVYAAMVDNIDQNLGRLLDTVEQLGELDDTIVVFTSDNGGTAEGGPVGTRSYLAEFAHVDDPDWVGDVPHDEELIGTARLGVHYPRGWGQASNTPFRFYKGQTFAGGVRVPFLVSWPNGLPANEIRREYSYVTDLAPTCSSWRACGGRRCVTACPPRSSTASRPCRCCAIRGPRRRTSSSTRR